MQAVMPWEFHFMSTKGNFFHRTTSYGSWKMTTEEALKDREDFKVHKNEKCIISFGNEENVEEQIKPKQ